MFPSRADVPRRQPRFFLCRTLLKTRLRRAVRPQAPGRVAPGRPQGRQERRPPVGRRRGRHRPRGLDRRLTKDGQSIDGAAVALSGSTPNREFTVADLAEREQSVSRSSDRRAAADATKTANLDDSKGVAVTRTEDLSDADPRTLARALMPQAGLSSSEFDCLDNIWTQESGWNVHADNPSSSAYGIPQALPGSKMSSAGSDWEHNPITQIKWGLGYIKDRYGTACSAWSFKRGHGWY